MERVLVNSRLYLCTFGLVGLTRGATCAYVLSMNAFMMQLTPGDEGFDYKTPLSRTHMI